MFSFNPSANDATIRFAYAKATHWFAAMIELPDWVHFEGQYERIEIN